MSIVKPPKKNNQMIEDNEFKIAMLKITKEF